MKQSKSIYRLIHPRFENVFLAGVYKKEQVHNLNPKPSNSIVIEPVRYIIVFNNNNIIRDGINSIINPFPGGDKMEDKRKIASNNEEINKINETNTNHHQQSTTKKINLENLTQQDITNFYTTNKLEIINEITKLQSDIFSTVPDGEFKNLRWYLLETFRTSQKGYITLFMIKILYIIYTNSNNRYKNLNHIIFNNEQNNIVIGIDKELYLETVNVLQLQHSKRSKADEECEKSIDGSFSQLFPTNTHFFPFDLSNIDNNKSNANTLFNRFLKQFQLNDNVVDKRLLATNELILALNKPVSEAITDVFNNINQPTKSNQLQEQEEEEITNIYSFDEYIEKFNNKKELFELNNIPLIAPNAPSTPSTSSINTDNFYIPNEKIELTNIFTLLNKYGEYKFEFLLSPRIKKKTFSLRAPQEQIIQTKIKVVQKEYINLNVCDFIVSKLRYICPNCNTKVLLEPNDVGKEIVHKCDTKTKTKIYQTILIPETTIPLTLYRCDVCVNEPNNKEKWINEIYIYSFNDDIEPGYYTTDIVKFHTQINILSKQKSIAIYMMLGIQRTKLEYQEEKIIKTDEEIEESKEQQFVHLQNKIYDEYKLPKHKIWNILFSIRQYYNNRFNIDIDDNGLFLQLTTLLTTVARRAFNENKIAISVMGVGSVSKTFPVNMIANMIDLNYKYISDTTRMTTAGMTGGINSAAIINGVATRKFEQGAISNNGIVTFDECQTIFLKPEMQSILKSIPQNEYEVTVIGGNKIPFNATPIFLSNFNEFMNTYEQKITDAYIIKYKSIYKFEAERRLKTNPDIIKYISQINLYQNIEYYYETLQDKILANTIYATRKQYEANRIDWKTGSQLEALNRILFDVVIHRKNIQTKNILSEGVLKNENVKEINLNEQMPTQQINEEIIKYIYNKKDNEDIDKIEKININTESNNAKHVQQQLQKLNMSIQKFLTTDKLGQNITTYFIQNVDNFDKKIQNLVVKVIITLQLIDDINATEINENTKKLANILLLKCKRGLSQDEYNMKTNVNEIKFYKDLNVNYLSDLENTKTEIYYDEKREKDIQKLEKKIESEYGLEKVINGNNTLANQTIDLDIIIAETEKEKEKKEEYTFDEICQKFCPDKTNDEAKKYVKRLKKDGIIYEPKNGIYKIM